MGAWLGASYSMDDIISFYINALWTFSGSSSGHHLFSRVAEVCETG
jgi:putative flippase GtrA